MLKSRSCSAPLSRTFCKHDLSKGAPCGAHDSGAGTARRLSILGQKKGLAVPSFAGCLGMKIGRPFSDPGDEFGQTWMRLQGRDCRVVAGQFGFRKRCVDFVVTDLMQPHGWSVLAAPQFWDKVMQALFGGRRDGPVAERADGVIVHDG